MFFIKKYSHLICSTRNYFHNQLKHINLFKIDGRRDIINRRTLFSSEHLGIDNFKRQRFNFMNISKDHKTEFFDRVAKQFNKPILNSVISTSNASTTPISPTTTTITTTPTQPTIITSITFTEDLKLALNLAETNFEVDLVVEMARNYNRQKGEHLTYIFGPPLMRLLHLFNLPTLAFTLATLPEFVSTGFFAQTSSRTILLDLLLNSHLHNHLWTVFTTPLNPPIQPPTNHQETNQQATSHQSHRQAADHVTLLAASCYRENTKEAFDRLKNILLNNNTNKTNNNIELSGRTVVYAGMLAYKQDEARVGLEMMRRTDSRTLKTTAYTNAMVLLLGKAGNHGAAVSLLQSMVARVDVFQEVLDITRTLVTNNPLLSQTLNSLTNNLANTGSLLPISFENYLNSVIRNNKLLQNSYKQSRISKPHASREYFPISKSRPGLR